MDGGRAKARRERQNKGGWEGIDMQLINGLAILAGVTLVTIVGAAWTGREDCSTVTLELKYGGWVLPDLKV